MGCFGRREEVPSSGRAHSPSYNLLWPSCFTCPKLPSQSQAHPFQLQTNYPHPISHARVFLPKVDFPPTALLATTPAAPTPRKHKPYTRSHTTQNPPLKQRQSRRPTGAAHTTSTSSRHLTPSPRTGHPSPAHTLANPLPSSRRSIKPLPRCGQQ